MRIVKTLITGLFILAIISAALYYIPWVHKINRTFDGVQFRSGDMDYSEQVTISVKGVYLQYLFKTDIFEGAIKVDKYNYTVESDMDPLHFIGGNSAVVMYHNLDKGLVVNCLGTIYCDPDFHNLLIWVNDPSDGGTFANSGLFISAPAKDRSQAIEVVKKVAKDYLADFVQ